MPLCPLRRHILSSNGEGVNNGVPRKKPSEKRRQKKGKIRSAGLVTSAPERTAGSYILGKFKWKGSWMHLSFRGRCPSIRQSSICTTFRMKKKYVRVTMRYISSLLSLSILFPLIRSPARFFFFFFFLSLIYPPEGFILTIRSNWYNIVYNSPWTTSNTHTPATLLWDQRQKSFLTRAIISPKKIAKYPSTIFWLKMRPQILRSPPTHTHLVSCFTPASS